MKNTTEVKNYTISHAYQSFAGSGHYRIDIELMDSSGNLGKFHATTTDMRAIDEINSDDVGTGCTMDEIYKMRFDIIEYAISDQINDWLNSNK